MGAELITSIALSLLCHSTQKDCSTGEKMEKRKGRGTVRVAKMMIIVVVLVVLVCDLMISQSVEATCPPWGEGDGDDCRNCLLDRMNNGCPTCRPILRCMAKCLWGGNPQYQCVKKCDCNTDYPRLCDCKECISPCKCSCATA